jgi:hypothetical protein
MIKDIHFSNYKPHYLQMLTNQQVYNQRKAQSTSSKRINSTKNSKFKIQIKEKCLVEVEVKVNAGDAKKIK